MQVYEKSHRQRINTFLFFFVVMFIAFLPVSSFQFFIKNDAFTGYFPPKYFMSESIAEGILPLWNPYINYGFPQYADMSGAYWSPFTWLIASTVGYNAYSFTLEILCYILVSGCFMYIWLRHIHLEKNVSKIGAVSYMCGGFFVAHLQHVNWLSAAALLPICLWAIDKLLEKPSFKWVCLSILIFYCFLSSSHPGMLIGGFYFFISWTFFRLFRKYKTTQSSISLKKPFGFLILFMSGLLLLSVGMFYAYADIMPYFIRSEKLQVSDSIHHGSNIKTWISFLFPLATVKEHLFYNTDLTMRNSYMGITMFGLLMLAIFKKKNPVQKFMLSIGVFFLLLSTGGILKSILYYILPGIGYVRLNGEFRVFAIFAFITTAVFPLQKLIHHDKETARSFKIIILCLFFISLIAFLFGIGNVILDLQSFQLRISELNNIIGIPNKIKYIVDNLTFYDCLALQGIIQILLIFAIYKLLRKRNYNKLIYIIIIDMIISALLLIPFTGAGKSSLAEVQYVLNQSPEGIPIPNLRPINEQKADITIIGNHSMYTKEIGTDAEVPYPIMLQSIRSYFLKLDSNKNYGLIYKPFLFTNSQSDSVLQIKSFTGSFVEVESNVSKTDTLVLQQSYYPHWNATIDGKKTEIQLYNNTFMYVVIPEGKHTTMFFFDPPKIRFFLLFTSILFLGLMILSFKLKP